MIARFMRRNPEERRAITLAVVILAQSLCAMFFLGDVIVDLVDDGRFENIHILIEGVAALALAAGVIFLMLELRRLLLRMDKMETGLQVARGEVVQVIERHFELWSLSPAERDVALLLVKGVDTETIATIRGTAKGTVRAQSAAIYAKAGVDGRSQLISLFLEELLANDAITAEA